MLRHCALGPDHCLTCRCEHFEGRVAELEAALLRIANFVIVSEAPAEPTAEALIAQDALKDPRKRGQR